MRAPVCDHVDVGCGGLQGELPLDRVEGRDGQHVRAYLVNNRDAQEDVRRPVHRLDHRRGDTSGYYQATEMSGPADTHLYSREIVMRRQILNVITEIKTVERTVANRDFTSFFDFETVIMMPGSGWRTRP